jgi:DNA invertase Pin-like site-specific DNA recombinase
MQDKAIREYLEYKGWTVAMAESEVMSAGKYRPRREEILKAARAGKIDAVVVWKLDRWGRSVIDLATTVLELHECNVQFISLTDHFDVGTPAGRLLLNVLASVAEFERDLIRERVRAGVARARARGELLGRPRTARCHSAEVERLHREGMNQTAIAKRVGISRGSVQGILRGVDTDRQA